MRFLDFLLEKKKKKFRLFLVTDAQILLHNPGRCNDSSMSQVRKGKRAGIFISARIIERCAEMSDIQQWQPDIPLSKIMLFLPQIFLIAY